MTSEEKRVKAREYQREWRAKNPDLSRNNNARSYERHRPARLAAMRAYNGARPAGKRAARLKQYGLTLADFEQMLSEQEGRCAICLNAFPGVGRFGPNVDHDHSTGQVRALLCYHCNTAIGKFQDNPEVVDRAAEYLRKHHVA